MSFNPRARAGRDLMVGVADFRSPVFQSTRPCGARLQGIKRVDGFISFNPRARAGRDNAVYSRRKRQRKVSIHAPVRGATTAPICCC